MTTTLGQRIITPESIASERGTAFKYALFTPPLNSSREANVSIARTSRTTPIVAEDLAAATGLTIDTAIDSYRRSLRAGNKSPATIKTYLAALAQFSRFLGERGMPRTLRAIRREHVEAFVVSLQDAGQRPATVSVAYRSLQPFFKWALGEDEIVGSPMERMTPPIVPEEPPAILREAELRAIFEACAGTDFDARRDTAIVRLPTRRPARTLGIIPAEPLPYWGWGDIPDQYRRRWDADDGESRLPADPARSDLPPLRPGWGLRDRQGRRGREPSIPRTA